MLTNAWALRVAIRLPVANDAVTWDVENSLFKCAIEPIEDKPIIVQKKQFKTDVSPVHE